MARGAARAEARTQARRLGRRARAGPRWPAFIVLEGGDASGKSTQARRLADRLRGRARDVVETFEPGATQAGAAIRTLLLDGDGPIDPTTEALLLAADRAQEVADVIRPALGAARMS